VLIIEVNTVPGMTPSTVLIHQVNQLSLSLTIKAETKILDRGTKNKKIFLG
jgi:D-alanine-D-alanine ligase-like ATP-grasp enzyme